MSNWLEVDEEPVRSPVRAIDDDDDWEKDAWEDDDEPDWAEALDEDDDEDDDYDDYDEDDADD